MKDEEMTFNNWWKDYGKDRDSCEYVVAKDAFEVGKEVGDEKIADIKANFDLAIEGRDIKIKELEQELTVQKDQHQEETNLHLHAEEYIKSLEEENNKLLDVISNYEVKIADLEKDKVYAEEQLDKQIQATLNLQKENEELKGLRCCENCKNVNLQLHWRESEEIDKRRQFVCGTCGNRKHWEYLGKIVGITETQQLTKAKEIIKKFSEFVNNEIEYDPEYPQEHTDLWNGLCEQAEQFLKEIEK